MLGDTKQILILFTAAVIASGCASNTQTDATSGSSVISVNSFEASPQPVPAGQTINLNMELENTGDSEAENVAARIFGPSFLYDKLSKEERTEKFGKLRAPSEDNPAIPNTRSWTFEAPAIGQNRESDYTIYSKIFYDYTTRGDTNFRVVSQNRYREQSYGQTDATLEETSGPISLDIRGTTPKIFYESDRDEGITPELCIVATNSGEGKAFTGGQVENDQIYALGENADEDTIELTIESVGSTTFDAKSNGDGNSVKVDLINGKEGYQCFEMNIDGSTLNNEETNINAEITADYNYVKETQTTATVEGRRGVNPTDTGTQNVEWDFKEEPSDNDVEALESGWDIDDAEDPSETCPALESSEDESAQDLFSRLCSEG